MKKDKTVGSGPFYYSLLLDKNNYDAQNYGLYNSKRPQTLTEDELLQRIPVMISQIFSDVIDESDYDFFEYFLKKSLEKPENHKYLNYRLKCSSYSYAGFVDNRNNILHEMTHRDLIMADSPYCESRTEFFKMMARLVVRSGINPLEKCCNYGWTPMAFMLKQYYSGFQPQLDLLDFFKSLSPDSLVDLSESGLNAVDLIMSNKYKRNEMVLDWLGHNLPDEALSSNLNSCLNYENEAEFLSPIIQVISTRLEKLNLAKNLSVKKYSPTTLIKI